MLQLCEAVQVTGEHVLQMRGDAIFDTVEQSSHQFSTVDGEGSNRLRSALTDIAEGIGGSIIEESDATRSLRENPNLAFPLFIADAVEGTTNAKRGLAAHFRRPIHAGTSVMVLENSRLSSVVASAFFDFASGHVFSSVRAEPGTFLPFANGALIDRHTVLKSRGDSQLYAAVPGYSHRNIQERGLTEEVLAKAMFRTTGGSRSSAQDLIDVLCNQIDAYVDLRARFTGRSSDSQDEVLHSWDVGGILPVLDGAGFLISDETGNDWQLREFDEPLALIVARPNIRASILQAISSLPFLGMSDDESQTIQFQPEIG